MRPPVSLFRMMACVVVLAALGGSVSGDRPSEVKIVIDAGGEPSVEAKLSATGDILVRPFLNNLEAGWFLLDPAAQGMRITPSLAKEHNLTASGTARLISSSRLEERQVWTGARFQLGPVVAEGLDFTEMTAGGAETGEGAVRGVVGTAILQHVIMEVEFDRGLVRLFDPATYDTGQVVWQEFRLLQSLPVVRCRLEGEREADFGLDLRSPLGIVFFSPTVTAFELLQDRRTKVASLSGTNFGKAAGRTGELEWFEALGLRWASPRAVFLTEISGLSFEKDLAGLLGREMIGGYILVLEYAKSRLSLLKR